MIFLLLTSTNLFAQNDPDSTKEREPYPETKSFGSKLLAAPQFIIELPFKLIEGFGNFLIEGLGTGSLATQENLLRGNFGRFHGFYPLFNLGGRSGLTYGLGFRSKGVFTKEERFKFKGTYSAHHYQNFKIQYRAPKFQHPNLAITLLGQYRKSPWDGFYGLGNDSRESDQVSYNPEHSHLHATGLWTVNPQWKMEFTAGYDAYNLFSGKNPRFMNDLDSIVSKFQLYPTDIRASRLWSVGGTLDYDWRNNAGQPTHGGQEIISLSYNHSSRNSDNLKFWHLTVDLRQYLELFKQRTLGIRAMFESLDPTGNSAEIPIYLRSLLGGADNLRGYRTGRFRDNDLALISVEYRYPLLELIDGFVFLDEGRVFSNLTNDFRWRDWKYSYGGGLRVWHEDDVIVRTFLAKSKEDTRFYLEFGGSF